MGSWNNLPTDLLASIINRLEDPLDLLSLRSVCSSWRSSSSPPPKTCFTFSLGLPFPISSNDPIPYPGSFSLSRSLIWLIQSPQQENATQGSGSCLVKVKNGKNGKLILLNPLSNLPIENLSPKFLDLLDFRVTQLTKCYNLQFRSHDLNGKDLPHLGEEASNSHSIWKVLFDGSVIFGIYKISNDGLFFRRLADEKWVVHDLNQEKAMDIAIHKGKYYVVLYNGNVKVFGSDFGILTTINSPIDSQVFDSIFYLTESFGDFFLVHSHKKSESDSDYTIEFTVYKLFDEMSQWHEMHNLADRTFFLSESCNFSVMAKDFPQFKGNCIYYGLKWVGRSFWHGGLEPHPFYRKESGKVRYNSGMEVDMNLAHPLEIGMYDLGNGDSGLVAHFPVHAEIFLPPPTCLIPSSSRGMLNLIAKRQRC